MSSVPWRENQNRAHLWPAGAEHRRRFADARSRGETLGIGSRADQHAGPPTARRTTLPKRFPRRASFRTPPVLRTGGPRCTPGAFPGRLRANDQVLREGRQTWQPARTARDIEEHAATPTIPAPPFAARAASSAPPGPGIPAASFTDRDLDERSFRAQSRAAVTGGRLLSTAAPPSSTSCPPHAGHRRGAESLTDQWVKRRGTIGHACAGCYGTCSHLSARWHSRRWLLRCYASGPSTTLGGRPSFSVIRVGAFTRSTGGWATSGFAGLYRKTSCGDPHRRT
jgi:hypothetical protein